MWKGSVLSICWECLHLDFFRCFVFARSLTQLWHSSEWIFVEEENWLTGNKNLHRCYHDCKNSPRVSCVMLYFTFYFLVVSNSMWKSKLKVKQRVTVNPSYNSYHFLLFYRIQCCNFHHKSGIYNWFYETVWSVRGNNIILFHFFFPSYLNSQLL